jgi:SAM-dependent methyltransferase
VQSDCEDFIRYLEAKKTIDDRSLNYNVWKKFAETARDLQQSGMTRFLEIGCGIGAMVERMIDRGLFAKAAYTGVDIKPELIDEAKIRLRKNSGDHGLSVHEGDPDTISLPVPGRFLNIQYLVSDIFDFVARCRGNARYDILIAHAFLDLVDPAPAISLFLSILRPGGVVYFTLNFDGVTIFEPVVDKELDALIIRLYHETMDNRLVKGKHSGSSLAGRLLPGILRNCRVQILAAGSSDWVLVPGPNGYHEDEVSFLHFIVNTVDNALRDHPGMDTSALSHWARKRHEQIEARALTYIAHQIDILGRLA